MTCLIPTHHALDKDGYPRVKYNKRNQTVVRVLWQLTYGEIQKGKMLCHTCDTPGCVNLNHIYLGGAKTNGKDKSDRHRISGSRNPNARFTDIERAQIKLLYHDYGKTQKEIAAIFNTAQSTISNIIGRHNDR